MNGFGDPPVGLLAGPLASTPSPPPPPLLLGLLLATGSKNACCSCAYRSRTRPVPPVPDSSPLAMLVSSASEDITELESLRLSALADMSVGTRPALAELRLLLRRLFLLDRREPLPPPLLLPRRLVVPSEDGGVAVAALRGDNCDGRAALGGDGVPSAAPPGASASRRWGDATRSGAVSVSGTAAARSAAIETGCRAASEPLELPGKSCCYGSPPSTMSCSLPSPSPCPCPPSSCSPAA